MMGHNIRGRGTQGSAMAMYIDPDSGVRYGAADSYRFVNAVVDKAAKTLRVPSELAAG